MTPSEKENNMEKFHPLFEQIQKEITDIRREIIKEKENKEKNKQNLTEEINAKIGAAWEKINQLSAKEVGEKNFNLLKQQLSAIEGQITKETNNTLTSLKTSVEKDAKQIQNAGAYTQQLGNRSKEVASNIIKSANKVVDIANGEDNNTVARTMQSWIKKLLS
ncbi:MAG: hypothetical protein PHU61_03895 [Candidatus Absconditabacteria bacterium]|nr:hypothetical protein [Candidatus Absconditabacteria bacterium]MDD3868581.1 hypothetical protein [Candidatus Absconditabacteria bacterium]MDD4714750.1 hypothetical protein [Candidatus Absconditabacteria bacterium]